ncbi:MAG: porin [Gallionella sp.]|nr:porin [Gallionella sp.]
MKKKLITLAVASTLVTAAAVSAPAFADTSNVTVYGVAHVSYDLTDNGVVSTNKVSSNQSRLGLKGSEDLGDGLSAVWQVEQQINLDTGSNALATRNSFLGLSSASMGTALLGRHDTPYKIATRGLDLFADSIADNRGLMGTTAGGGGFTGVHDARLDNVVAYISPAMSGFTGAIAHVSGAELVSTSAQVKGNAWSVAGMYGDGPINASLAYQVVNVGTANTGTMGGFRGLGANDKAKAWKLGGGYKMDAITVNAAYEKTSNTIGGASAGGQNNWYLGGKYGFGNDAVKLAYTRAGDVQATSNTGAKQWALGYDHSMSKRTTLYALYTRINNDTNAAYGLATTTGATAAAGNGQDPSAWSFGMKHTF